MHPGRRGEEGEQDELSFPQLLVAFDKELAAGRWCRGFGSVDSATLSRGGRPWSHADFIMTDDDAPADAFFYWEWNALRWCFPWPIRLRVRGEQNAGDCPWWQKDVRLCLEGSLSAEQNLAVFIGMQWAITKYDVCVTNSYGRVCGAARGGLKFNSRKALKTFALDSTRQAYLWRSKRKRLDVYFDTICICIQAKEV